jgi:carbonic anhydrase/acetyltransferase-like protein (isoleucine patch superfamily)
MPVLPFRGKEPVVAEVAFLAPDAWVTGAVTLGKDVSVLFGAVLRGDLEPIVIGERSNIQDHVIVHTSAGRRPCIVGAGVNVGHRATLHGCTIANDCLIGMGAVVMDDAEIGERCIIGAQSLVPVGMSIPPGSLAFGSPARVIRPLKDTEIRQILETAERYVGVGQEYGRIYPVQNNTFAAGKEPS